MGASCGWCVLFCGLFVLSVLESLKFRTECVFIESETYRPNALVDLWTVEMSFYSLDNLGITAKGHTETLKTFKNVEGADIAKINSTFVKGIGYSCSVIGFVCPQIRQVNGADIEVTKLNSEGKKLNFYFFSWGFAVLAAL